MIETVEMKLQDVNSLDGVLYQDIKDIINDRESLENIIFNNKVLFLNQDELVEFINKLIKYGYEDMALDYLENIYDNVGALDFSNLNYENHNKK